MRYCLVSLAVGIVCALLYLSNAPKVITRANFGGDGGDFLAAALTGGIPHPTGYPTYTLLAGWFQKLPFGEPYWKGVLLSLLPACLSAALLAGLISLEIGRKKGSGMEKARWRQAAALGGVTGLAWGVSPLLWSQAVIVEVHGLQALLICAVLGWAALLLRVDWRQQSKRSIRWLLLGCALIAGLGMGNHVTLTLALPAVITAGWVAFRRGLGWRWLLAQIGAFVLGLSVYLYLPLSARSYPPINWGNPQTWEGFRWLVTAEAYQRFVLGGDLKLWIQRLAAWAGLLAKQYGAFGVFLGAFGLFQGALYPRALNLVFAWVFAAYSLFAMAYSTVDSTLYLLPAFLVFAAWVGAGLAQVVGWRWKSLPLGWLAAAIFLLLIVARIPATWREVDPRRDSATAAYCEGVLASLPQGALLFTYSEGDTFPLWFYHFGLQRRTDLRIVVSPLTQFAWYRETLFHTYPDLRKPEEEYQGLTSQAHPPGWTPWTAGLAYVNSNRVICWSPASFADGSLPEPQCGSQP